MKVILSMVITLVFGLIGLVIEFDTGFHGLAAVMSIVTMGGFIMNELRKK